MKAETCGPLMEMPRRAPLARPIGFVVRRLGRLAAQALESESRWVVQAVFRRSFYCRGHGGGWVCLGLTSLGAGPLNILCDPVGPVAWEECLPGLGASATREGSWFRVGDRLAFSLAGAEVWRPATPPSAWQSDTLMRGMKALAREVRTRPVRGGFQALIPLLAEEVRYDAIRTDGADPLVRLALDGIKPLAEWLETRLARPVEIPPAPVSAIDALIGLGPGLTPSGDDFLGGVMVALHHLGASGVAKHLATEALARAEQRTNDISRAHLAAAAEGEGLAPLHAVLESLCAPGAPRLDHPLSAVDAIGHSSGWDALAGVACAAAIMARVRTVQGEM